MLKTIYHFVVTSDAWEPKFHENFFVEHHAFLYGLLWALVIGLVIACGYYFLCCNDKNSIKLANLPSWCVAGVVAAFLSFFVSNWIIIGKSGVNDRKSLFYTYSFYNANDNYYNEEVKKNMKNDKIVKELATTKQKIKTGLDQGNEVRAPYAGTTTVLGVLFFALFSFCVKGMTRNGKHVPVKWPSK